MVIGAQFSENSTKVLDLYRVTKFSRVVIILRKKSGGRTDCLRALATA